ncbi:MULTISPECIES: LysR family transcriptional regulator [Hyphomicrobiales]|uniref:LysR family transcriptional regulator n=1 Tax=Hyphomicrobiales TaxID=356 RepID=UPI001F2691A0|nr:MULTISPECIES: LysR family transcriptional regulator [Hyphomicrobiales]
MPGRNHRQQRIVSHLVTQDRRHRPLPGRAQHDQVVKVVELGGLAPAARALGFVTSAVSRIIARLETRLGVKLLRRSTRRLALTDEGERFYQRAVAILAETETAEREAAGASSPTGRVRINSSASYVTHVLRHILPAFLEEYPGMAFDIIQTDSVSDLIAEASDIAVRAGPMANSELIARPLGDTRIITVAAPHLDRTTRRYRSREIPDRIYLPASCRDMALHVGA